MKLEIGKRSRIVKCIVISHGELNVLETVQLVMLLVNTTKHYPYRFKLGIIVFTA